jgi:hypothetical protein
MVFHQAIAWAVNRDADGFVRALAMHRMFEALPPEARPGACVAFAEAALRANPYALPAAIAAIDAAANTKQLDGVRDAIDARLTPLTGPDGSALLAKTLGERIDGRRDKLGKPGKPRARKK